MFLLALALAYQPVLDKHGIDEARLRAYGFELSSGALTPTMTPGELDYWLTAQEARAKVLVQPFALPVFGGGQAVPIVIPPAWYDPQAPGELDALALEIQRGKGDPVKLRRALAKAADMTVEDKRAFVGQIQNPLTLWIALSRSRAPHSVDGKLYFERFEELLAGRSIADYAAEVDPKGKWGASFLLRANSYDALIPYLNRRPSEAAAVAPLLFPDKSFDDTRERADRLEALMTQLAARGRKSGALDQFVVGLSSRAAVAPGKMGKAVAAYLKVNEGLLRRPMPAVPGLVVPSAPRAAWPVAEWVFAIHFADTDSYKGWQRRMEDEGWVDYAKDVAGVHVRFEPRLWQGDEHGFIRGKEQQRFLGQVTRDLRDADVQGVILRIHAQFRVRNLFDKKVTPGKLFLDGSCRSGWDLSSIRKRCPTCHVVVNTGTGYGVINNEAVLAVVEGLALDQPWDEIGEKLPSRMQGPWTPPYADALSALED